MRLWSLHPQYLDAKGLVACWRESLLARAVLSGKTTGYRHHPQLERFRLHPRPIDAINCYLSSLYAEALARGYSFDPEKIAHSRSPGKITVTNGQVQFELKHLKRKLWQRDRRKYQSLRTVETATVHPLFRIVDGEMERWER